MNRVATTAIPYEELEVAGPWDGHNGNYDTSREAIDRIIIHTMVGTTEAAANRFANATSHASAHYGIRLDGSLVHWLEEFWTAYHADDLDMNRRSIGIEHEDNGDYNGPRTDALYQTSAKLVADICSFYSIPCNRDHIKKHNEVSDHPTGCPDALDIDRIVKEASEILNPAVITQPITQWTDQTKVAASFLNSTDFPVTKDAELQQVRGWLGDLGRAKKQVTDLESQLTNALSANTQQAETIKDLTAKLTVCENSKTLLHDTPSPSPTPLPSQKLPSLFRWLFGK